MPSELAIKIAKAIKDEYSVGVATSFCDESDWDELSENDLAELIDKVLPK